ncbi:MAG TPA: hypothetical protein VLY23_04530 [Candidatus Acidoferrum sp.]|nr:hypothetical protein [Candidatus Acidoferrum sp.]
MSSFKTFATLSALVLAGGIFAGAARAQSVTDRPAIINQPVAVKTVAPKAGWLKAEVIHFDSNSMTVREVANERMVHTFTYAASAQPQVQRVLNKGGYQYGDRVRIRCQQGQTVALAIHGKPSKPL